ncbi:hypothetical protein GCM10022415_14860 [Knoellia locipacati]|uniref:Uncharacterized protein n=1 Tax=Knoellia locipacati TaxID=882824 RepID=A0A512SZN5_9MICO|nr:hypothetical protein [Knoellia locipacati]GEQ13437.1 hypothetical protein KLO01_14840 [Knoellia locipacati]
MATTPPQQPVLRPRTDESPRPARREGIAALRDVAIGVFFVVFTTSRLHAEGFGWLTVTVLILASGALGAKIAIYAPLLRTTKAQGQAVPDPS